MTAKERTKSQGTIDVELKLFACTNALTLSVRAVPRVAPHDSTHPPQCFDAQKREIELRPSHRMLLLLCPVEFEWTEAPSQLVVREWLGTPRMTTAYMCQYMVKRALMEGAGRKRTVASQVRDTESKRTRR